MAGNLTAIVRADTSGFAEEIKAAKYMVNKFTQEMKQSGSSIKGVCNAQVQAYSRVINGLSKVANGSKTTKQAQKELQNQIQELKIQWANLSNEARSGGFGQSLADSLRVAKEQLKTLSTQLDQTSDKQKKFSDKSTETKSVVSSLSDKFGINIGMVSKLSGALGLATGAFDVLKNVISQNETLADEWGRTIETAGSIFNTFCNSLSNADFTPLFKNFTLIVQKARDAADAIDNLGTKTGVISNKQSMNRALDARDANIVKDKTKSEKERKAAQNRINSRKSDRIAGFKETQKLNSDVAKKLIEERLAEAGFSKSNSNYEKIYKQVLTSFYKNQSAGTATYNSEVSHGYSNNISASQLNKDGSYKKTVAHKVNLDDYFGDDFRDKVNTYIQASWNAAEQGFNEETKANKVAQKEIKSNTTTTNKNKTNKDKTKEKLSGLAELENKADEVEKKLKNLSLDADPTDLKTQLKDLNEQIKKQKIKLGLEIDEEAVKKAKSLLDAQKKSDKIVDGGAKEKKKSSFDSASAEAEIEANKELGIVKKQSTEDELASLKETMDALDEYISKLKEARDEMEKNGDTSSDSYQKNTNAIKDATDALSDNQKKTKKLVKQQKKEGKQQEDLNKKLDKFNDAGDAISSIGNTFSQLGSAIGGTEGEFLSLFGTVMQGIAEIIPQIATLVTAKEAEAVASGTASASQAPWFMVIPTIASVVGSIIGIFASIGSFADGGIIAGSTTLGDMNIARVNGGEMILNGTQQKRLFNMLDGNGYYNNAPSTASTSTVKIKGSDLYLALSNYNKKSVKNKKL